MRLLAAYADDGSNGHPPRIRVGEGLIGQCAADRRRMLITNMPSHAVPNGTALFNSRGTVPLDGTTLESGALVKPIGLAARALRPRRRNLSQIPPELP